MFMREIKSHFMLFLYGINENGTFQSKKAVETHLDVQMQDTEERNKCSHLVFLRENNPAQHLNTCSQEHRCKRLSDASDRR